MSDMYCIEMNEQETIKVILKVILRLSSYYRQK